MRGGQIGIAGNPPIPRPPIIAPASMDEMPPPANRYPPISALGVRGAGKRSFNVAPVYPHASRPYALHGAVRGVRG